MKKIQGGILVGIHSDDIIHSGQLKQGLHPNANVIQDQVANARQFGAEDERTQTSTVHEGDIAHIQDQFGMATLKVFTDPKFELLGHRRVQPNGFDLQK